MKEEERRSYNIGMQIDSRTSNGLIILGAMLMVAGLLVQIFSINITLYLVSPYGDPGVSSTFLSFIGVACASLSIAFREAGC